MTVSEREGAPLEAGSAPFEIRPGGFLLVVSGPSGAGKGSLVEQLLKARTECVYSISSTTRPMRAGEQNGVQYEFVTREEFERRRSAGYFLEWAEVHGQLYGTPARFVDEQVKQGRVVVLEVDVQGGASVRRARPDSVSVFVSPPSFAVLRERLLRRGTDSAEVVERRMRNASGEMAHYKEYDYVVMNNELEKAAHRLIHIVDAERARVDRLTGGL